MFIGVTTDKIWRAFCSELDLPELVADPRFVTAEKRLENQGILIPLLSKALKQWVSDDLAEKLSRGRIPYAKVLKVGEMLELPHVNETGMVIPMESAEHGRLAAPGIPIRMSETPGEIRRSAPRIGEHTEEILGELGYSDNDIDRLQNTGAIGIG
jgi:crotonobetainyl-CoA:carnitine CoA-transferase CaiB-like acyl-CoA transferase